jgi:hypothetical protein
MGYLIDNSTEDDRWWNKCDCDYCQILKGESEVKIGVLQNYLTELIELPHTPETYSGKDVDELYRIFNK